MVTLYLVVVASLQETGHVHVNLVFLAAKFIHKGPFEVRQVSYVGIVLVVAPNAVVLATTPPLQRTQVTFTQRTIPNHQQSLCLYLLVQRLLYFHQRNKYSLHPPRALLHRQPRYCLPPNNLGYPAHDLQSLRKIPGDEFQLVKHVNLDLLWKSLQDLKTTMSMAKLKVLSMVVEKLESSLPKGIVSSILKKRIESISMNFFPGRGSDLRKQGPRDAFLALGLDWFLLPRKTDYNTTKY